MYEYTLSRHGGDPVYRSWAAWRRAGKAQRQVEKRKPTTGAEKKEPFNAVFIEHLKRRAEMLLR